MNIGDFDILELKQISDVYDYIDKYAFDVESTSDFLDLWVKYRNAASSIEEKQKAQWEIECNMFHFEGGKVFSFSYSYTTEKNAENVQSYPNLDQFQREGFAYLNERALASKSSIIKARYYHLLWIGIGKKNRQNAFLAIENYISAIQIICKRLTTQGEDGSNIRIGRLHEHLIALCNEVSQHVAEVKKITKHLLFDVKAIKFYTKHTLTQTMLDHPKIFKAADFENILSLFEAEFVETRQPHEEFMLATIYLPTAVKVAQKTRVDVKRWYNEIALALLRSAQQETDESRYWLLLDVYSRAIDFFRRAGNIERKKETEQLYFELKPKVKLQTFRVDLNEEERAVLQNAQDLIKEDARKILKRPPHEVYAFIAKGAFFPKQSDVEKAAKNGKKGFLNFVTTIYFDKNKNVSKKGSNPDNEELFNTFALRLKGVALPLLHYTIVLGIQSGHLTAQNFISYLSECTWIGKPHIRFDLGGEAEEINYIEILAPAIIEYFNQVMAWGASKYYVPSFILCIDSLTLKIEGLLRNFCERLNVSTSVGKKKGMQEALISSLLDNDVIKKYFNDEDLFLFNYVFSSEYGINLRNNVAHCFYQSDDYSADFMLLLIAIILRIGKYNIKEQG